MSEPINNVEGTTNEEEVECIRCGDTISDEKPSGFCSRVCQQGFICSSCGKRDLPYYGWMGKCRDCCSKHAKANKQCPRCLLNCTGFGCSCYQRRCVSCGDSNQEFRLVDGKCFMCRRVACQSCGNMIDPAFCQDALCRLCRENN